MVGKGNLSKKNVKPNIQIQMYNTGTSGSAVSVNVPLLYHNKPRTNCCFSCRATCSC
ncbi:hypothetical protein GUJ93_ZPchr0014g46984 [Zizania palustris]|uniref:Uncharacterized protein n=1 Tax=Zizania palustris TaxID=103762 RepID=A0A8J5TAM8_ZIZPA|nr:hypothetical protein GUJ93_ZPchr0014g46984 [Zizania palustris]